MIVLELIEGEIARRTELIATINKREQTAFDEGKQQSLLVKHNENIYYDARVREVATRLFYIHASQAENLNYVAILRQIKTLIEHTETIDQNDIDLLVQELRTRVDHIEKHRKILLALFQSKFITNHETSLSVTLLVDPVDSKQEQKTRNAGIDLLIENLFYIRIRHFASSPKPVR